LNKRTKAILFALTAALLYGIQVPFSKLLEEKLDTLFLAAFLYLGAGIGMMAVRAVELLAAPRKKDAPLGKKDIPFVVLMILLDIAAPILLLMGLRLSSAGTVSLLGNFEIAATAVLAMLIFHEAVGKRLWIAIALISLASMILSVGDLSAVRLSPGSLLVLLACAVWGLENNCTRKLSGKSPMQIVILKGCGSGSGALILALLFGPAFRESFRFDSLYLACGRPWICCIRDEHIFLYQGTKGAGSRTYQRVLCGRPFCRGSFVMACPTGENNMDIFHGATSYDRRNCMRYFGKTQPHACSPA